MPRGENARSRTLRHAKLVRLNPVISISRKPDSSEILCKRRVKVGSPGIHSLAKTYGSWLAVVVVTL